MHRGQLRVPRAPGGGELRLTPGNDGGLGEELSDDGRNEHLRECAGLGLAAHRRLRLGKLRFLAGSLSGYVDELSADRIKLLAVDCRRPGRTAGVVVRRFLVQPVLLTVL